MDKISEKKALELLTSNHYSAATVTLNDLSYWVKLNSREENILKGFYSIHFNKDIDVLNYPITRITKEALEMFDYIHRDNLCLINDILTKINEGCARLKESSDKLKE